MSQNVQMTCEDSINLNIIPQTLFCICCLKQTGPYVKLGACSHREYLDSFPIPDKSPPLPETVCYNCHGTLKKVAQFRLQVQESFNLLEKEVHGLEKNTNFKTNLKISEISHLEIPELMRHVEEKPENESNKLTKMKNIETALKILNSNTPSLQSLSSCDNLIGLTESLLQITANNLSLIGTPLPQEPKIKNIFSSHYGIPVLPDKEKHEPEIMAELICNSAVNTDKRIIQQKEDKIHIDIGRMSHKHEMYNNYPKSNINLNDNSVVLIQKELEIQNVSEKSSSTINNKHIENNDSKTSVLPTENNKASHADITNGENMLPGGTKDLQQNLDDNLTMKDDCLREIRHKEYYTRSESSPSNGASQHKRPSPQCLIPIKLNRRQLIAERQEKMNSCEFLSMEYRCGDCITGFLFKENFDDHIKRKHTMKDPRTHITCEICHQMVLRGEIREHMCRHYNRLECKKCKKRFVLFDEAFDHYSSVHTPLKNKTLFKRKLLSYIRSRRLQFRKSKISKCNTKSSEASSTDCTESHLKSSHSK